jgi:hypothetical protein
LAQRRGGKKLIISGREDVFLVHLENGFNGLILNWCISGCWFIPALPKNYSTTHFLLYPP